MFYIIYLNITVCDLKIIKHYITRIYAYFFLKVFKIVFFKRVKKKFEKR